jgi:hypothetical protein
VTSGSLRVRVGSVAAGQVSACFGFSLKQA